MIILRAIKVILLGFCLFLAISFVIFYAFSFSNSSTPSKQDDKVREWAIWDGESEIPNANVVVYLDDIKFEGYDGALAYAYGIVHNYMSKTISYIQISVGLYVDNVKMGSCFVNQDHIVPDTSWQFKALCSGVPNSKFQYKVDDVTYW